MDKAKITFEKELHETDSTIKFLIRQRNQMVKDFRRECLHPKESISITRIAGEDEFGKYVPEWDTYSSICNRCGATFQFDKLPKSLDEVSHQLTITAHAN